MQGQAIKSTDEAIERSQSLVMMRNIAEKIHANPSCYSKLMQSGLNSAMDSSSNAPTNQCGLDGTAS